MEITIPNEAVIAAAENIQAASTKPPLFIERQIETVDGVSSYKVLVVDSAEKWAPASEFTTVFDMPIPGSAKKNRFKLTGPSLKEWEVLEIENHLPGVDENLSPLDKIAAEAKQKAALDRKYIAAFEISTGKKVPGNTPEDKVAWLKARNPGETGALFAFLTRECSGRIDGHLLGEYNLDSSRAVNNADVIDFKDFDDWKAASECKHFFRINRYGQDFIVEFPLRSISAELKRQIDDETIEPEPPQVPARNPETKKFDRTLKAYDRNNPQYLRGMRAVNQKRTAMYLEACLPFEIPGSNHQDKYNWIAERLMGDVIRLKQFIEEELIGWQSRYNFS